MDGQRWRVRAVGVIRGVAPRRYQRCAGIGDGRRTLGRV